MANVLDLRRRIRSVKNTRQITKAMKMVSAAKLRRAQDRAMQARPYAQMLTNVLESLVRRTDLLDEATGNVMHPLLVEREEKTVLVLVIAGDKGFAGGFNSNIGKAAQRFIDERSERGQNVDLEPVGKKAIGLYKRRYPAAVYEHKEELYDNDLAKHIEDIRHRAAQIEVAKEHTDLLVKANIEDISGMAHISEGIDVIGINNLHHPNRQRFTLAHELGHLILHPAELARGLHLDRGPLFRNAVSAKGTNALEVSANAFAAELLMPSRLLHQLLEPGFDLDDEDQVGRLARRFRVSVAAMHFRLNRLW